MEILMTGKSANFFNSAKNTFNLLQEWKNSKEKEDDYYFQAQETLRKNQRNTQKLKQKNKEEQGASIAKAGASGVKVSSFNDALFYNDLKNTQEIYENERNAQQQYNSLRKKAKSEKRNRNAKLLSYSIGLISKFPGFG